MATLTLHRHPLSGHAHRAELFLSLLGLEAELNDIDLAAGEHKQPPFLAKNLFGQIPVLEDGDTIIADANAILVYLAQKYDSTGQWYPTDAVTAAEVQRFLSVAAGQIASGPAAARLVNVFGASLDQDRAISIAHAVLEVLNTHLDGREWLAAEHVTIADIANYSYIAHAPEGDVSLEPYPNVQAWLARIEALQGFVPMQKTAAGLSAG